MIKFLAQRMRHDSRALHDITSNSGIDIDTNDLVVDETSVDRPNNPRKRAKGDPSPFPDKKPTRAPLLQAPSQVKCSFSYG